ETGDADALFLHKDLVAVGWAEMGDLSVLPPNRDAFKQRVAETYPHFKPGAIPNAAGQLYRFVYEIKPGDLVVYPSKRDRSIHIGRVTGAYRYDPSVEPGYPNQRAVTWLTAVPRTS